MIPDKLYLSPVIYGSVTNLSPNPDCEGEIEYIRKDALLEWANNWKKLGQSDDFLYAMEILVQHLNSI